MIKLVFTKNRETISIEINDKIIWYTDRKFPKGLQFMPEDPSLQRKVIMSRNRIPKEVVDWIHEANSGKNLEEYQEAENDEALVPIIKKDAGIRGCVFQKQIKTDEEPTWHAEAMKIKAAIKSIPTSSLKKGAWDKA